MLAKRPEDRFATPSDVATALAAFLDQHTAARSNTQQTQPRKQARLRRTIAVLLSFVVLTTVVIIAKTNNGVLEIDAVEEDVEVQVPRNGRVVRPIYQKSGWKLDIPPGEYKLTLEKGQEQMVLEGG